MKVFILAMMMLMAGTPLFAANGNLLVDGKTGIGTANDPVAKLEVNGEVKIGNTGLLCSSAVAGTLRYNSGSLELCNGSSWIILSGTSAVSAQADTTAPVTTASPAGGLYLSSVTVALSANKTADIYYTVDGTTPTTGSTKYSAPIVLSTSKTLKFFARDSQGNSEAVKTQSYIIDTVPPTTTPSRIGGTYSAAQIVSLSTDEPATIYYTLDGTIPTSNSMAYNSPITISATTTLKYFARDLAQNNEAVKIQTYIIDGNGKYEYGFEDGLSTGLTGDYVASISGNTHSGVKMGISATALDQEEYADNLIITLNTVNGVGEFWYKDWASVDGGYQESAGYRVYQNGYMIASGTTINDNDWHKITFPVNAGTSQQFRFQRASSYWEDQYGDWGNDNTWFIDDIKIPIQ